MRNGRNIVKGKHVLWLFVPPTAVSSFIHLSVYGCQAVQLVYRTKTIEVFATSSARIPGVIMIIYCVAVTVLWHIEPKSSLLRCEDAMGKSEFKTGRVTNSVFAGSSLVLIT